MAVHTRTEYHVLDAYCASLAMHSVILCERLQKVNKFHPRRNRRRNRSTFHPLSVFARVYPIGSLSQARAPPHRILLSRLHPLPLIPLLRHASTIDVASIDEQTRVSFEERCTYHAWDLVLKTHPGSIPTSLRLRLKSTRISDNEKSSSLLGK